MDELQGVAYSGASGHATVRSGILDAVARYPARMDAPELGRTLRRWREEAHLSREDIARALGVGRAAVGHYETAARPVTVETVFLWARACGRDVTICDAAPQAERPLATVAEPAREALIRLIEFLPVVDADGSAAEAADALRALPPRLRRILSRLARAMPHVPDALLEELEDQADRWAERWSDSPTAPNVKKV